MVDPSTGSVKLRAMFDNKDDKLFPSQFVNIRLLVDTLQHQTVIPVAAVQRGAAGTFVFVVTPEKVANQRTVKLGIQDGDKVAVTEGLKPGDTVVVDGADRLRDGADVEIPGPGKTNIQQPSGAAGADALPRLPIVCSARLQRRPVGHPARLPGRHAQRLQPARERTLARTAKHLRQRRRAIRTETGHGGQLLRREVHPVQQMTHQAGVDQRLPGALAQSFQLQSVVATEPHQPCEELSLATRRGLPAGQRPVRTRVRRRHRCPLLRAPGHRLQARDGQPGQHHLDLVARTNVKRLPALERAHADPMHVMVVQLHRRQFQHRRDAPAAADGEAHRAHLGQRGGGRIFPGHRPVRRSRLPGAGRRPVALAQHRAVGGVRQRVAVPLLAPVPQLVEARHRLRERRLHFLIIDRHQGAQHVRGRDRCVRPPQQRGPEQAATDQEQCEIFHG